MDLIIVYRVGCPNGVCAEKRPYRYEERSILKGLAFLFIFRLSYPDAADDLRDDAAVVLEQFLWLDRAAKNVQIKME